MGTTNFQSATYAPKKIPIYEQQVSVFFDFLLAEKLGKKRATETELVRDFASFSEKLIIWGDPRVIKAWDAFRSHTAQSPEAGILHFEKLMFELRKDVGSSNSDLRTGDLLKIFINDLDPNQLIQGRLGPSKAQGKAQG
jgi:hypothetical protein